MAKLMVIVGLLGCLLQADKAHAAGFFGPHPDYAPSVFSYGVDGFWTGALVGVSGGYLAARSHGFESDDWRPLVLGAGIGALSGAAVGITLGFADLADDRPGMGSLILRDMGYGGSFGLLIGAVTGALVMIRTDEPEHIGLGAAIGALSGAGAGLIIGAIEGRRIVNSPAHRYPGMRLGPSMAMVRDAQGGLVAAPTLRGAF